MFYTWQEKNGCVYTKINVTFDSRILDNQSGTTFLQVGGIIKIVGIPTIHNNIKANHCTITT